MRDNTAITIILAFVVLVFIIYLVYKIFWAPQDDGQLEVVSSENDPFMKQVSEFRNTFATNLMSCLGMVWFISPQEIASRADLTDWNSNLFTIVHQNHLVRCYINWKKGLVKVSYSFHNDCYEFVKSKNFRLKNHTINFEKFTDWAMDIYRTILLNAWPSTDDQAAECIAQGRDMATDEKLIDVDFDDMVFEVWRDFIIHTNKKEIEKDLVSFSKLTAYVVRYCPEQLKKFVEEHKKINSK